LIAADVISKKGKIVQISRNSHLTGKCLKKDNWSEVKSIENEINDKKTSLCSKQAVLHELINKYLAVQ